MTRNSLTSPTRELTPTDGRRLRWTQHRAERRAAFVDAGVRAIDLYGAVASAEQIAEEAGVSRTVLYRYFRDRDDLRQAIAENAVQQVLDGVMPKLQLTPQSTPHEIIHAAISVIVRWLDEHPNLYYFLRNRTDASSLESVEKTLADTVAALLKLVMVYFGMSSGVAEPHAHGIVGFVEASGGWWLQHRTMSREAFTEIVSTGVWHMLEGSARDAGIQLGYDEALPVGAPTLGTVEV
ncbi:TetR family transcriptional regulator [uncultured Jatrophihabitans sp.]|uniref:TetR family transcriptional regulator n=1 Tax=uncultured Jatrophihabitans sp. TaxID=1610747 RepID=UPI0035CC3D47